MNHTYCLICSYKNLYSVSTPPFCQGCGKPLNRTGVALKADSSRKRGGESDDEDDDDFSGETFNPKSLAKDWFVEKDSFRRPTFEDLINNPVERRETMPRPESDAGLNGAELLKQIRNECSRSRDTKEVK